MARSTVSSQVFLNAVMLLIIFELFVNDTGRPKEFATMENSENLRGMIQKFKMRHTFILCIETMHNVVYLLLIQ